MGWLQERFLEYLPDAQCGDPEARLHLLSLGADVDYEPVPENLAYAAEYRLRGLSVVPQLPGSKCPCVKWKPFQDRRQTVEELHEWWSRWPNAGIALVLGSISGVFAVDIDGEEAHRTFVEKLGEVPIGPKSLSGSGKPFRYHLLFRPPPFKTTAKFCPWHPKLELRGDGGIIVVPPSIHKSGKRYAWADGRSIFEQELPELPGPILDALAAKAENREQRRRRRPPSGSGLPMVDDDSFLEFHPLLACETCDFLRGDYSEGPGWNDRLFKAACDLAGNGVDQEIATRALISAACPWNPQEHEAAMRTIESAYSIERSPAREQTRVVETGSAQPGVRLVSRPVPQVRRFRRPDLT